SGAAAVDSGSLVGPVVIGARIVQAARRAQAP
ncbi:MAG: hypothetical protein RL071_1080, partial [Pseudomonadota bacterium]